jgi:hypothetical protein
MLSRIVIVGAILAAVAFWGPIPIPNWALVAFVLFLLAADTVISVRGARIRKSDR